MASASATAVKGLLSWIQVVPSDGEENAPEPRWGHTVNAVSGRYLVVMAGLQAGRILSDSWVYDNTSGKWGRCITNGAALPPRWGHTATQVNSHVLVVLGGRSGSTPAPLDEVRELNLRTMTWTLGHTSVPTPKSRYAHGAAHLQDAGLLLVFGGHGGRSRYFNDICLLKLESPRGLTPATAATLAALKRYGPKSGMLVALTTWAVPPAAKTDEEETGVHTWLMPTTVTGEPPTPRSGFTLTTVGSSAYVIGGFNGRVMLSDVSILNTLTWTWTHPEVTGSGMPTVVGHSAELIGKSKIVIFGGGVSSSELSGSMWILDTATHSSQIYSHEVAPSARFWHRSAVRSFPDGTTSMIIFGGNGENGLALNDMVELDVSALVELKESEKRLSNESDSALSPRGRNAGTLSIVASTLPSSALCMAVGLGGVGKQWIASQTTGSVLSQASSYSEHASPNHESATSASVLTGSVGPAYSSVSGERPYPAYFDPSYYAAAAAMQSAMHPALQAQIFGNPGFYPGMHAGMVPGMPAYLAPGYADYAAFQQRQQAMYYGGGAYDGPSDASVASGGEGARGSGEGFRHPGGVDSTRGSRRGLDSAAGGRPPEGVRLARRQQRH